ncbi:MAG TPA: MlaD family protein [Polyangiaceae bacterium]|nr:MlaD family protein [Polyangiaceae bacterium]
MGYLVYTLAAEHGPMISITFETADGLSAQQTQVKYKAVTLGTVEQIELANDLTHVTVKVRMNAKAAALLTDKTRFWVVRPRFSGGLSALQTGLETLVSGAYVAVDPGPKGGRPRREFKGLEKPPSTRSDEPGSVYRLDADSLGGLSEGAPIYYRDVNVGEVLSFELDKNSQNVSIRIFVRAPYDENVTQYTRFWNSSGIRVDTGAMGLRVELQSVKSLLSGGIAFRNPINAGPEPPSKPETTFRLYADEAQAEVGFYSRGIPYVSYFQSSVRGLSVGSEVQMFGEQLGSVTSVDLTKDPRPGREGELAIRVGYVLQPERALRKTDQNMLQPEGMHALVHEQLRVVLESSSFLTGQKELSLQYVPGSKPKAVTREGDALVLPSDAQDLQGLTSSLSQIVNKVNGIPFEQIGDNANRALASLDRTIASPELQRAIFSLNATLQDAGALAREAKTDLGPALARLPQISEKLERAVDQAQTVLGQSGYGSDSTTQRNLDRMMSQVGDAARSIRLLADYLNRHPESVLSGRKATEP